MNFFRNPLSNITNSTILLCGIIIVFRYVREVLSCISAFRVWRNALTNSASHPGCFYVYISVGVTSCTWSSVVSWIIQWLM